MAIQAGASLVAILLLAWIAARLRLGGDVRIRDEDHARQLAGEAVDGFEPVALTLDRARIGAMLRDAQGRVMVLRRNGSHFAARLLTDHSGVRLDRNLLTVSTGERRFGSVTLDLGAAAQEWAASLRHLKAGDAR
ncbi:MAG: hypothetical protein KGL48_07430 [Sphingomonadales bacterium]|nr:hypothetical protein [Sphingomonadales bacterium]MDE2569149.1 hypothetical protein [Sphingomonadales bacterium]